MGSKVKSTGANGRPWEFIRCRKKRKGCRRKMIAVTVNLFKEDY